MAAINLGLNRILRVDRLLLLQSEDLEQCDALFVGEGQTAITDRVGRVVGQREFAAILSQHHDVGLGLSQFERDVVGTAIDAALSEVAVDGENLHAFKQPHGETALEGRIDHTRSTNTGGEKNVHKLARLNHAIDHRDAIADENRNGSHPFGHFERRKFAGLIELVGLDGRGGLERPLRHAADDDSVGEQHVAGQFVARILTHPEMVLGDDGPRRDIGHGHRHVTHRRRSGRLLLSGQHGLGHIAHDQEPDNSEHHQSQSGWRQSSHLESPPGCLAR